jgi:DNA repair exonuclease SbcCD ATPase subunit
MKITLTNFGCYINETFEFPDNGLMLISAPSGKGKSTIIKAILFVLFNIGRKLCTFGEKSCKVKMVISFPDISTLKITRTKCPNRLILKKDTELYEDIVAQSVINEIYGSNFPNVSFMDNRNIYKSFLMMTPMEKLKFLENFAFENVNVEEIKEKVQTQIREKSKELSAVKNGITIEQKLLERIPIPEQIDFPIKYKNREKAINNEKIKLKNTLILLKKNDAKLQEIEKVIRTTEENMTNNKIYLNQVVTAKSHLEKLQQELAECENIENVSELIIENDLYEKQIEYTNFLNKMNELEKNIEKMEKAEQVELQQKIIALKSNLPKNPIKDAENKLSGLYCVKPKFIEYEKYAKKLKEYTDISQEDVEMLKTNIKNLSEKIDALTQKYNNILLSEKILVCPGCNINLVYTEGKLENVGVINETEKKELVEKEIIKVKKEHEYTKKMLDENTALLIEKNNTEKSIEELTKSIEEKGFNVKSLSVSKLNEDIDSTKNLLSRIEKETSIIQELENRFIKKDFSSTLKAMINEYNEMVENKNQHENIESVISAEKYENNKKSIILYENNKNILESLKKKILIEQDILEKNEREIILDIPDIFTLKKSREKIEQEAKELKEKKSILKNNLETIDIFLANEKTLNEVKDIQRKINELENQETTLENEHSAALKMKQKILECESLSIYNIIDSINSTAGYYLDKFFVEDNITAKLLPFKLDKKKGGVEGKPQINLSIIYKEEECDINNLSGGELSRLILAFTLALAEIYNTRMILLDESTANLDHENTQNVFEVIKENFKDILVIAIAHQVVEGSYDHVMYL